MREYNTDPNYYNDEIWRHFPDKPFQEYVGSNYGRVKNSRTGRILRPGLDTSGYEYVILNFNKQRKNIKVHRFILRCFNDIPNHKDMTVNHIDANHINNKLENLEWKTFDENLEHAYNLGLLSLTRKPKNKKIKRTKRQKEQYSIKFGAECVKNIQKLALYNNTTPEDLIKDEIEKYIKDNENVLLRYNIEHDNIENKITISNAGKRRPKKIKKYERYYIKKKNINAIKQYCEKNNIENIGDILDEAIEFYLFWIGSPVTA